MPRLRVTAGAWVLVAAIVVVAFAIAPGAQAFAFVVAAVVAMVASVLLHEAGHVLMAQALGFHVTQVHLSVMGATTVYEADHRTAHERVLVAAAGPAVSVALAVVFALIGGPWEELAALNLLVALLNLIPIPGFDGWDVIAGMFGRAG
jgi:Zn-dependent protease